MLKELKDINIHFFMMYNWKKFINNAFGLYLRMKNLFVFQFESYRIFHIKFTFYKN